MIEEGRRQKVYFINDLSTWGALARLNFTKKFRCQISGKVLDFLARVR